MIDAQQQQQKVIRSDVIKNVLRSFKAKKKVGKFQSGSSREEKIVIRFVDETKLVLMTNELIP